MIASNRTIVLLEILFFVTLALSTKELMLLWVPKYAGPITLIFTLLILTQYMRLQGKTWTQYGLISLVGMKPKLMVIPQAALVFIAFGIAVGSTLVIAHVFQIDVLLEVSDGVESRFGEVRGNLPKFLMWIGIVWVSAAFGEEMFFRGYLITRLQEALPKKTKLSAIIAVLIPALIFGFGHYHYQGIRGFIITSLIGFAFGVSYLLLKKNLWPIILLHGVINSISFAGLYLDTE